MAQPSPWDASGTANSLADAIRRQADAQAAQASKKKNGGVDPSDPLAQLMAQIQAINTPSTPYDLLLQQATGSAGAQYDPLIAALRSQMGATTKRARANESTARQMYGDVAKDIAAQMPEITNRMAQATQETESRYNDTQAALADQYSQQSQQQAELFNKLGIQAATPGASQQAMDDQAYFQQQSKSDEASALDLLKQMTQSDVSYNQQTSNNTRLAGVNAAQDIETQLEDYIQQAQGQLTGLESSKTGAVQSLLAQLQQQDAQRVQESEQQQYKRLMDMFNLQLKMQNSVGGAGGAGGTLFKGTNGPSGASNYLGEMYGNDSFTSKTLMEALNDVISSPEAIAGKYRSPDLQDSYGNPMNMDVTPEYLTDMLRKRLQEGDPNTPLGNPSISDADVNNAINALLAYLGKLK